MTASLLFLHGVGDGDPDDVWSETLDSSLRDVGYPGLADVNVIAPKYPNSLNGVDDDLPLPRVLIKPERGDRALALRREFLRRRTALEVALGGDEPGRGLPIIGSSEQIPVPFKQVRNYLSDRKVRAAVLHRIIQQIPATGPVVIVAHSLGSIIAADLLRRLNPDVAVAGMVTIGSPLGFASIHLDDFEANLREAPGNLGWWVNFWSPTDVVVGNRGISPHFPWVLDHRVRTSVSANPKEPHFAASYLAQKKIVATIGRAVFGSLSKEVVLAPKGVELRLDFTETVAVLRLKYAHILHSEMRGGRKARFAEALRQTQAETVSNIAARNEKDNRPLPSAIVQLAVDLSDPDSEPSPPTAPAHIDESDACQILIAFAELNVIHPFEIEIKDEERERALGALSVEMGFGKQLAADVFDALDRAEKILRGSLNWKRWAAIGLGGSALAIATGGLAFAAAPGAVGAAAITSALAAFGPGGMIGGLLTAGSLVGAGSGSLAVGIAAPETSADVAEMFVTAQLANVLLHESRKLPPPEHTLNELVDAYARVRDQFELMEAVSDPNAASVKALRRKRDLLARAVNHLSPEGDLQEVEPR